MARKNQPRSQLYPSSNCIYRGPLTLYKSNDKLFNGCLHKVFGQLTDSHLCCYQHDKLQNQDTIRFKLQMDHVLSIDATKDKGKRAFITIKTRQHGDIYLFTSNKCIQQWYSALLDVHNQYKNDMYSHDECIDDIMDIKCDDTAIPQDIQCPICHEIYANPVKNSCGNTYCYQRCIERWYKQSIQVLKGIHDETFTKCIHDPKTNCALPQNSLLLIPDFKALLQMYQHVNKKEIAEADRIKYMRYDAYLNHYRKKIIQRPLHKEVHQNIIKIGCDDNGLFNRNNLAPIVDEIWRLFDIQNRVYSMIGTSVKDWNQSHGKTVPFKWRKANFENIPAKRDKNIANDIIKDFGVDALFESALHELEIDAFVTEIITILIQNNIHKKKGNKVKIIDEIKAKITTVILSKQQEIIQQHTDHDVPEKKTSEIMVIQHNVVAIDSNHQIWFSDDMRCIREMMQFVHKRETFALIFEDSHGELTCDKLRRFLDFGGFKHPVSVQQMIYNGITNKLKYNILKISSKLQRSQHYNAPHKCTNYWKYVLNITPIKNPDRTQKAYINVLWLKVRLKLNYVEELSKFDYGTGSRNAKHKMKKELRDQLAHHLGLTHKHFIVIHDIYAGSVTVIVGLSIGGFVFLAEKIYMATSIRNGRYQKWLTPKKSAIASAAASTAVLGAVGAVEGFTQSHHALGKLIMSSSAGSDIAAKLALSAGPIGAIAGGIAGVILAGAVFACFIAYAQHRKNLDRSLNERQPLINSADDNKDDDDDDVRILVSPQQNTSEANNVSLSDLEEKEIEEAHVYTSTSNETWKGYFVMRTRSYSQSQSMDSNADIGRKVLLECGHEFDIKDVDTISEYLVTCMKCGKRSFVTKEYGGGSVSYRHIFEYCNDEQLMKFKQ